MRCGTRLVIEGDSQFRVLKACGQPDFENTFYKTKYRARNYRGFHVGGQVEVRVDEWTYNFGSRRLVYVLRFENGYLKSIETDQGYGF